MGLIATLFSIKLNYLEHHWRLKNLFGYNQKGNLMTEPCIWQEQCVVYLHTKQIISNSRFYSAYVLGEYCPMLWDLLMEKLIKKNEISKPNQMRMTWAIRVIEDEQLIQTKGISNYASSLSMSLRLEEQTHGGSRIPCSPSTGAT